MNSLTRGFGCFSCAVVFSLLAAQAGAADYLLDASTMAVGATAGENLVVQEGCIDRSATTCTQKYKWLTSISPIKLGRLDVSGQLKGDFEATITAYLWVGNYAITLLTPDNRGVTFSIDTYTNSSKSGVWAYVPAKFTYNNLGSGGDSAGDYRSRGFTEYGFNEIKIAVQQGVANVYTNGKEFGTSIKFDPNTEFNRVVISGITSDDWVSEVKVRGIQSASTSCPTTGTTSTPAATLDSNLGMRIPNLVYQPAFGNAMKLWADLQFSRGADGSLMWKLKNYGVNP